MFTDAVTTASEATKRLWTQIDALLAELVEQAGPPRSEVSGWLHAVRVRRAAV